MQVPKPLYLKIYQDLIDRITSGEYRAGMMLPSETALCKQYGVSRITAKRALDLLREQGYIMRRQGSGSYVNTKMQSRTAAAAGGGEMIGLILSSFSDSYGSYTIAGVEEACRQAGYHLLLRVSGHDMRDESEAIFSLIEAGIKGLLLIPQHNRYYNPDVLQLMLNGFPLVVIDREMKGVSLPYVGFNNFDASRHMAEQLIERGHRQIAFLSSDVLSASSLKARLSGFKSAFFAKKLIWNESLQLTNLRNMLAGQSPAEQRKIDSLAIRRFLNANPEVTAVFATEYEIALMVFEQLDEMGIQVPEEMSVVSFDGPVEKGTNPFLTRTLQPEREIGKLAVQTLINVMMEEPVEMELLLNGTYLANQSIADVRPR